MASWSSKTLDEMAEHVAYEMWMLNTTTRLIEARTFPTASPDLATKTIGNALLESSLMHLRSLDDFLGLKVAGKADDVIALDYLSTWKPKRILTDAEREYINKRLAHITTARKGKPEPWQLQRSKDGYTECRDFLGQLKQSNYFRFIAFEKVLAWFPEIGPSPRGVPYA